MAVAVEQQETLLIGGRWTGAQSGRECEQTNPFTGEVAGRAAAAGSQDVELAVTAASEAFEAWGFGAPAARREVLSKAADLLQERAAEIATIVTEETGGTFGWGMFNVQLASGMLREAGAQAYSVVGEVIPSDIPGATAIARRQPAGVVVGIAPWNAPVILGTRAIATPLAFGNTVVLKGSELCPRTHAQIVRAVQDAGAPEGVINYLTNDPDDAADVVDALIAHPKTRRINFTGSTRVGKIIAESCGRHLKRCLLELGGKAPMIVMADADLDEAAAAANFGAFMHSGQICMATERIIVDSSVAGQFTEGLVARASALKVGDPSDPETQIGPLINEASLRHVSELVDDAVAKGAEVATGGESEGPCYRPTVLTGVTPEMRIYAEESFGPVVPILEFDDLEDAIATANDTNYGLAGAVFSTDIPTALDVAQRIESGICHVNNATVHDEPQMPFGGVKESGWGRFGGNAALDEFTDIHWTMVMGQPRQYPDLMKAASRLIELVQSEGVDRVFGNPGTTELPLMDALARVPEMPYYLGLHEGTAVSMADGFARATGRPSFLNLHIAAGLAHGLANMLNARRARTPMVVTVGQQDRRHLIHDPMLGGDLLGLAQGVFKNAVEVNRVEDLSTLIRRAFLLSQTEPTGPVMVSIPVDVLEEELDGPLPARTEVHSLGVAEGVEELAEALLAAGAPAIVAGDGVGRKGAVEDLVGLAEAVGATVFEEPMYDCVDFPATHPLSAGMLPPVDELIRDRLSGHDVVLLVASHAFSAHYYTESTPIPDRTRVLQLDSDRAELGRNYPASIALYGGIGPTLRALTKLIDGHCPEAEGRLAAAQNARGEDGDSAAPPPSSGERMVPAAAAQALVDGLPADTIMLEEAITTGLDVRRLFAADRPGSYHHSVGGALGWAIGGGIGVKMARPDQPVVSVVGDGTAMYTIQGLWSAAHYEVPLVVVVMNNREYAACKRGMSRVVANGADRYVGMDLTDPEIDFIGLATALGVEARSATSAEELTESISAALASGRPTLIDAAVAGTR